MSADGVTLGSLFDGSGTAPLAARMCGIEPIWCSEIEPFPIAVTRARFPDMKHYGNICDIKGDKIEPVDIICGGSPCQDLSVAGKRAGLEGGERSVLFHEQIRITKEMRHATNDIRPRFAIWENVPGAFSSNKGEDFRCVLEAFCQIADESADIPRPAEGRWAAAGCVVGNGWSVAWRTLDAQCFGVPQRRRRIFLVADFGSECAAEILSFEGGSKGNITQSGEAWETTPGKIANRIRESESGIRRNDYGKTEIANACEILREMRKVADKAQLEEWLSRSPLLLQCEKILQSEVFKLYADRKQTRKFQKRVEGYSESNDAGNPVREMWEDAERGCSSHGRQSFQQLAEQFDSLVQKLPYEGTQSQAEMHNMRSTDEGIRVLYETLASIQESVKKGLGHGLHQDVEKCFRETGIGYWSEGVGALRAQPDGSTGGNAIVSRVGGVVGESGTDNSLTPWDCQGRRVYGVNGIYPTLSSISEKSGQNLQAVCVPIRTNEIEGCVGEAVGFDGYNQSATGETLKSLTSAGTDSDHIPIVCYESHPNDSRITECKDGIVQTLSGRMGTGGGNTPIVAQPVISHDIVRRLVPRECAKLQGFDPSWCDNISIPNPTESDIAFWQSVWDTYQSINGKKPKSVKQIVTWLKHPHSDSAEYKMWGNGMALPCVLYIMRGIISAERPIKCN